MSDDNEENRISESQPKSLANCANIKDVLRLFLLCNSVRAVGGKSVNGVFKLTCTTYEFCKIIMACSFHLMIVRSVRTVISRTLYSILYSSPYTLTVHSAHCVHCT